MISELESKSIKYIRSFAMISIFLCHLQQTYNNKWAWIFNVGVQIFLAISGWLYGNKSIRHWNKWGVKKIYNLYIPYIIYVLLIFCIYSLLSVEIFSWKKLAIYILDLQWILGGVKGISHLWFMTAIFLCYLITPILQIIKKTSAVSLLLLSVIGFLNLYIFKISLDWFSCIFVYSFSYLYASSNIRIKRICNIFICVILLYLIYYINWNIILDYTSNINKLFHITIGISCVILSISLVNIFNKLKVLPIVDWFDKQSYYIYITHHIFMLGPLSLAYMSDSIFFNISLIVVLTITSSIILKYLSEKITVQLKNIQIL